MSDVKTTRAVRRTTAAVAALAAAALVAGSGPARPAPAPPEAGERVAVSLRLEATRPAGAADVTGTGDTVLGPGERRAVYVGVSPGLCTAMTGGSERGFAALQSTESTEHLWWADVELLDVAIDGIRLAVDWTRYDRDAGELVRIAGGTRTVELREGRHHLIDFVPGPQRDRGQVCYENVLVDLTAKVREDRELAGETLRYELWFVHDSPDGRRTARLTELGKQGELVGFRFEPLRWPVARDVLAGGKDAHQVLDMAGTLRGRLRRDGSIDVELRASRWLGVAPEDGPRSGGIGDGGDKVFSVRPHETVKMTLPDVMPEASHALERAGAAAGRALLPPERGVVLGDRWVTVRVGPFFEDHEMSLVLTVTRAT